MVELLTGVDNAIGARLRAFIAHSHPLCFVLRVQAVVDFAVRRSNGTIVDSSSTLQCGPLEIAIGLKFCVRVWERAVKTMRVGERARFFCQPKVSVPIFLLAECVFGDNIKTLCIACSPVHSRLRTTGDYSTSTETGEARQHTSAHS